MNLSIRTYHHGEDIPPLPGSNVFYSTALFRALEQTPKHTPVLIVAYQGDIPVGKLTCITRRYFGFSFLFRKTYAYGTGEYFNLSAVTDGTSVHDLNAAKEAIFEKILDYITYHFGRNAFLLKFRNLEQPLFGYRVFRKNGFFPIRRIRVRNSIHKPIIDKWMSASRKRQISQGFRNGAVTEEARTQEDVIAFFDMLKKNVPSKTRHYLPPLSFFIALLKERENGNNIGGIFLVRYKERIIGGSVCLFSNQTCYLVFSVGLRKSYLTQYPGVICIWAAMKYAQEQQFRYFEFIDTGIPFKLYGYHEFILRFGGKQISTRRWLKIRFGWLNKFFTRIFM